MFGSNLLLLDIPASLPLLVETAVKESLCFILGLISVRHNPSLCVNNLMLVCLSVWYS